MYKGTNPSAKRSQNWIAEALVSLMLQKKLKEITVKEIMNATDLSRQTFYQVFDSIEDVMEYHMDTLFQEYIRRCKVEEVDNLCDAAQLFFRFFNENTPFVEALTKNNKTCILQKKCQEYLHDDNILNFSHNGIQTPEEKTYASAFVAVGLVGMLDSWFKSGKTLSTDKLADLVCRITNSE